MPEMETGQADDRDYRNSFLDEVELFMNWSLVTELVADVTSAYFMNCV